MKNNSKESVPIRRADAKGSALARKKQPKTKVKIDYNDIEISEYYLAASKKYRVAKTFSFVLLIAFLTINLVFFRDNITYSNVMYLLRDLDTAATPQSGSFAAVSYNEESDFSFDIFKGRLAVSSANSFTLYNQTGARELDFVQHYQNPAISVGEKYAISYDIGGYSYNIFTTMASVYSGQSEEIIEKAVMANDGGYALLTRSSEKKYLVTVYGENLKEKNKYYTSNFVVDIEINDKTNEIYIVSLVVGVADISTEITVFKIGTDDDRKISVDGSMPLAVKYLESGKTVVLCDDRVLSIEDDKAEALYEFKSKPQLFSFSEDCFAVLSEYGGANTPSEIVLFNSNGEAVYTENISEAVNKISCDVKGVYTLGDSDINAFYTDGTKKTAKADSLSVDILPYYGALINCGRLGAFEVVFE